MQVGLPAPGGLLKRWFTVSIKPVFTIFLLIISLVHLSACGSGGEDKPFVFTGSGAPDGSDQTTSPPPPPPSCKSSGDCAAGTVCEGGICVPPECKKDGDCRDGKICDSAAGKCITPTCTQKPDLCSATQKCVNGICECDPAKTVCAVSEKACAVDLDATLTLKIDDAETPTGHFDSPPACCEYAAAEGGAACPMPANSPNLDSFLKAPSENTDLFCCAKDSGLDIPNDPSHYCDLENRHSGAPELAAKRWPAAGGKKIQMTFDLSGGGCKAALDTASFPDFRLENTALDAAIVINAGARYQEIPPKPAKKLNEGVIVVDCSVTEDAGNVQVAIPSLPIRFMVDIYQNFIQCVEVKDLGPLCPTGPFASLFFTDDPATKNEDESAGAHQIIPGFGKPPLTLTTGTQTQAPVNPSRQNGPMTVAGRPLQFDPKENKTKMSLVTAFSFPDRTTLGTSRDDETGSGQLLAELGNALLSAEIAGAVTRKDGSPIKTKADLLNCAGVGPTTPPGRLELSMKATFDGITDPLTIAGDPAKTDQPFTTDACVPGRHNEAKGCVFSETSLLPFTKDPAAGDPSAPELEPKFAKEGVLTVESKSSSTIPVTLKVPEKTGAFRVTNANALQNITLAPGNSTALNLRFEPATDAAGCGADATRPGFIACASEIAISQSPLIKIALKGSARVAAAEIKVEEVSPAAQDPKTALILPSAKEAVLDFGEALVDIQTQTKLLRVTNTGVRDLAVTDVRIGDPRKNFRLGSFYQGPNFRNRSWQAQRPWKVTADGRQGLFFFANFGPFDPVVQPADLTLTTSLGTHRIALKGTPKNDKRATLALFIQDENRFSVSKGSDVAHKAPLEVPAEGQTPALHFYTPSRQVFSFRQDGSERAVYLAHSVQGAGLDSLILQGIKFNDTSGGKFVFKPVQQDDKDLAKCLAASPNAVEPCMVLAPGTRKKIGTIQFNPSLTPPQSVSAATFSIRALSRPASSSKTDCVRPVVAGNETSTDNACLIDFAFKGANGAPNGTFDLKIHRLIAGFEKPANSNFQKSLIVSTATKGIITRFGKTNPDEQKEVFSVKGVDLKGGIILDPVTGQVTLRKIVTPLDPDMNNPAFPSAVNGLRLYNALGSTTSLGRKTEYSVECLTAPTHDCGFFYIFIGDWSGSTTGSCNGKLPVLSNPATQGLGAVLRPDPGNQADVNCLKGENGIKDETGGVFDPVTGEITLNDLAVRLYAPKNPVLGGGRDIDATIRLSLTTGCVTPDRVPDTSVQPQYLVPQKTLDDKEFDRTLMPQNPLLPYVDLAGSQGCAAHELHGRPMFTPDTTGTLDNENDPDDLPFGFDIAGVGQNLTTDPTNALPTNMYIVIKAEVVSP